MGNTLAALEAIYYSQRLVEDKNLIDTRDLNWAAAIHFLQNCQNLPAYNKQPWASDDPKQKGGFVYYPGHSMAGNETNPATGTRGVAFLWQHQLWRDVELHLCEPETRRSARSGGLRLAARELHPGGKPRHGPQGLYFYLHTMTKALTAYGVDELELKDGRKLNWRKEVAMRLINLQQRDGSWSNDNGRWWEKDPALVTSLRHAVAGGDLATAVADNGAPVSDPARLGVPAIWRRVGDRRSAPVHGQSAYPRRHHQVRSSSPPFDVSQ
jgi:squalene-hopene/tetraprenyl-beta-curcumene cyclase